MRRALNQDPVQDQFPPNSGDQVRRSLSSLTLSHVSALFSFLVSPPILICTFLVFIGSVLSTTGWHCSLYKRQTEWSVYGEAEFNLWPLLSWSVFQLHRDMDVFQLESWNCRGTPPEWGQQGYCCKEMLDSRTRERTWTCCFRDRRSIFKKFSVQEHCILMYLNGYNSYWKVHNKVIIK